jgi:transposase
MPRSGPRKLHRYSDEFKLTAVRLSQQPGIQVQTVAAALEIHPFMLSKWRKDLKDGRLRGRPSKAPPSGPAREIAQLQALERKYAELQEEHDLLKKAIRFWAARRATSSPSSTSSSRSPKAIPSLRSVAATASRPVGSTRGVGAKKARTRRRTGH